MCRLTRSLQRTLILFKQRQIQGGWIGDQANYMVGKFDPRIRHRAVRRRAVPSSPYVPLPPIEIPQDSDSAATMGTELLATSS